MTIDRLRPLNFRYRLAPCLNEHISVWFFKKVLWLHYACHEVCNNMLPSPPPLPSSSSKRFRTQNRTQIVKNLNFLGLPKSNYSLTVKLRMLVNWFSPEMTLEVHLKLLQNSSWNRRESLKSGNVELWFSTLCITLITSGLKRTFRWKKPHRNRTRQTGDTAVWS